MIAALRENMITALRGLALFLLATKGGPPALPGRQ
jgi:hypothetical protein